MGAFLFNKPLISIIMISIITTVITIILTHKKQKQNETPTGI